MVIYSVEWTVLESASKQRRWFATPAEAERWIEDRRHHKGKLRLNFTGPMRHVVEGSKGLLSFANTYAL